MLDISHEPDLGYIFFPSELPHHPGHPRLDIILTEVPTERHFDPLKVQFQIVSPPNQANHLTIHHPGPLVKSTGWAQAEFLSWIASAKK
jgi:hypothetical protein